MNRHARRVLAAALLLALLGGCGKKDHAQEMSAAAPALSRGGGADAAKADAAPTEAAVKRFIALRHALMLTTDADRVEAAWRAANDACGAAGCELLSSTMSRDDANRPAAAALEARVPPEKFDAFIKQVTALGTVGRHSKTAEDKTAEVIDVEARIRNMSEFRDNLRRLMATPGAKLKDLIEVERELVRVQSEIDALASRRKVLASETEKVHVAIQFNAHAALVRQGMWSPVRHAVVEAGHVFASSLAVLIAFVVAVLPWLIGLALAWWGLWPAWRGWRARRKTPG